jgi:hypothetical protein
MNEQLGRAQAYQVDGPDGRIGSVAAVLTRAGDGFLLVHSGLISCRLTAVPFSEVATVDPDRRRVLLHELPATMLGATPHGARERIVARA